MLQNITVVLFLGLLGGVACGQDTAIAEATKSRIRWDAMHATELSPRESLKNSKALTESDRTALLRAIKARLRPHMVEMDDTSGKNLASIASVTRIQLVDLNGDGVPEVLAQSLGMDTCGAVGNCKFWVFKRTGNGYISLLDTVSQSFVVEKTRSEGFLDLTLEMHDSASERQIMPYHFRNGKYLESQCYDANWSPDPNGPELNVPVVTRCK